MWVLLLIILLIILGFTGIPSCDNNLNDITGNVMKETGSTDNNQNNNKYSEENKKNVGNKKKSASKNVPT